jgi:hypothetical protein
MQQKAEHDFSIGSIALKWGECPSKNTISMEALQPVEKMIHYPSA